MLENFKSKATKAALQNPAKKVRLVVSDIDGTLITSDKILTDGAIQAALDLKQAGVKLCLVSSRPPQGIQRFFSPLKIHSPFAALNGGEILNAKGKILTSVAIEHEIVWDIIRLLHEHKLYAWLFGGMDWWVFTKDDPFLAHEIKAIGCTPQIVSNFNQISDGITKIGGNSHDTALLDRVAQELEERFPGKIKAARSSGHFLDITHPLANKGYATIEMAKLLNIDISETACIGDMDNDIAMLQIAGLSIAMGQSSDRVQSYANFVTDTNENNGWAKAIRTFILPRV